MNIPVYVVGGAIRDEVIGVESIDSDFLVLGPAESFAEKSRQYLSGSKVVCFPKFKSAFFKYEGVKLEFTEPRIADTGEGEQDWVKHDLLGRDFTINAISAKITGEDKLEIFDPLGGLGDLKNKILRTPVNPVDTFSDDPVRIMRALRFAARFNLSMDRDLLDAIKRTTKELSRVSSERIGEELWKTLKLKKPSKALIPMLETGIFEIIIPEIIKLKEIDKRGKFNHKDIFLHSMKVVDNVAESGGDTVTRFAALLHDIAKPLTRRFDPVDGFTFHGHEDMGSRLVEQIGKRLRLPKDSTSLASKLTLLHMRPVNLAGTEVSDSAIRRLMTQAGEDLERLLKLCRADITSGNPKKVKKYLKNFDFMVERMSEVVEKDEMRAFQSPVRGEEIMEICGIGPGPLVGKIKKEIEEAIIEGIIPNDYNAAKEYFLAHKDEWMNR